MKFITWLLTAGLLFASTSSLYAFNSLYDVLEDSKDELVQQVELSSDVLLEDLWAFTQQTVVSDDFNNLICLGLGTVSIQENDINSLSHFIDQRIRNRYHELLSAVNSAQAMNTSTISDTLEDQYMNILEHDINTYKSSYQDFFVELIWQQKEKLQNDALRFGQLALSNKPMLDDLTIKRTRLADLEDDFSRFESKLQQWSDFWNQKIVAVGLEWVIRQQMTDSLEEYFAKQRQQLLITHPHLILSFGDLDVLEDQFKEQLRHELTAHFNNYLGYYDITSGYRAVDEWRTLKLAYYVDQEEMNCPVIVASRQERAVSKVEEIFEAHDTELSETISKFGSLSTNDTTITMLSSLLDAFFDDFSAEMKASYLEQKNWLVETAESNYNLNQQLIRSVRLPFTQSQLLAALESASSRYAIPSDFRRVLENAVFNLEFQLAQSLSDYDRALYTLLHDTILIYLQR